MTATLSFATECVQVTSAMRAVHTWDACERNLRAELYCSHCSMLVEFTGMLIFCKLCNARHRVPFEFVIGGCTFATALLGQFHRLVVEFLSQLLCGIHLYY